MFLQIPQSPPSSRGGGRGGAYGDYDAYGGYDNQGGGGCDAGDCDDYSSIELPSESREKNSESEES